MKCSVLGCPNDKSYDETLSYFKFPKDKTLQQKWLQVINRPSFVPKKHHLICEDHFQEDELIHFFTRKQLAKNAIPSQNLSQENSDDEMQINVGDCTTADFKATYQVKESYSKASGSQSKNTNKISNSVGTNSVYSLNNQQDKIYNCDAEVNTKKEAATSTMDNTITCAVPHCPNTRNTKIVGLSFYDFPEEPDMKSKWLDAIGRRFDDLVIKKGSFVCSNHFIVQHLHMLKPSINSLESSQRVQYLATRMQNVENNDYIEHNSSNIELDDPLDPESRIDNEEINSTTIALDIEPTEGFDVEDKMPANIIKVGESDVNLNDSVAKALPIYSATGQQVGIYLPSKKNEQKEPRLRVRNLPREEPFAKAMSSDKQTGTTPSSVIPIDEVFELRIPESWKTIEVKDIDELHCESYKSTYEPEQSYQNISYVPPIPDKKISLQACLQSSDEENDDSLLPYQYVNLKQKLRILRKYLNKRKVQVKTSQQKLKSNQKHVIKYTNKRNELKADNEELRKELRHDNISDTVKYKLPSWKYLQKLEVTDNYERDTPSLQSFESKSEAKYIAQTCMASLKQENYGNTEMSIKMKRLKERVRFLKDFLKKKTAVLKVTKNKVRRTDKKNEKLLQDIENHKEINEELRRQLRMDLDLKFKKI